MKRLIVTGTDTGVGKTVVAAMLTLALGAIYWKPVQAGLDGATDLERVVELASLPPARTRAERFRLRRPLSPHCAAELDGVGIAESDLELPGDLPKGALLLIEGAGGVLVPLSRGLLQVEMFRRWDAPAVLVARTALGTINHTLLSLETLRARGVPALGVIFVGDPMPDTERTIADFGKVKILGRLPLLARLDAQTLSDAFAAHFTRADFETAP